MKYDIDEINKLDILEVAKDLGMEIKKRGSTFMVRCPWHEDTNPSMQLFPKTRTAHCYVCCRTTNVWGLIKSQGLPPKILLPVLDNEYQTGYKTRKKEALLAKPKRFRINSETEGSDPSVQKLIRNEEYCVFPSDSLDGKMTMDNSFVRCLVELFGGEVAAEAVRKYRLGSWPAHGRYPDVMFPSIDRYGRIRDIKIQAYDCDTRSERFAHREKTCFWLSSVLFSNQLLNQGVRPLGSGFNRDCLFGEHLLSNGKCRMDNGKCAGANKVVVLVESPKNAVMGDCICPQMTWVAAGNKGMLKREVLSVLKGKQVIVFPDEDAYSDWEQTLSTMKDIADFKLIHTPGTEPKRDIADWIIKRCMASSD